MARLLTLLLFVGILALHIDFLAAQIFSGAGSDPSMGGNSTTPRNDIGGLPVPLEGEDSYERQYRYGNTYLPSSVPRLNMTREEVVRQKQLDRLKMDADAKKAERQLLLEFRVKQGSLGYLLDETNRYLPQVLKKSDEFSTEPNDVNSPPSAQGGAPTAPSDAPKKTSVPNPEETVLTEDERIEKDLRAQLQALELSGNEEEQQQQKEALEKRIEARNRWQARRAEAERGADVFLVHPSIQMDEDALKEGWCRLFDGKTLFGWRAQQEGPYAGGQFRVENREIMSDTEHPGLLYTTNQFGDMTLQLDYWMEEDAEAYLLLRSSPNPRDLNSSCYAVVLNSPDFRCPAGTILGRSKMSVEQLRAQSTLDPKDAGTGWRTLRAQCDGPHLRIRLDATEAQALFEMNPLGCGYIGLLVVKGSVRFRNMLWCPGSALPLFDGLHPEKNWKKLDNKVRLDATVGITMQLSNGPGIIESRETYDNFVIQIEYNIAYTAARTGLFFRSQMGSPQSGYAVSIQNFPLREDRDSFLGVDVGAFRNRKNGRYVRPEDQKWNYLTLLAVDRQFQTWVNGLPVCEMSDRRPTDTSQKDGPFLTAGTIQLLAPETGTEVQFRNLRITPIVPRYATAKTMDDRSKNTWDSIRKEWKKNIQEATNISNEAKPPVVPRANASQ